MAIFLAIDVDSVGGGSKMKDSHLPLTKPLVVNSAVKLTQGYATAESGCTAMQLVSLH